MYRRAPDIGPQMLPKDHMELVTEIDQALRSSVQTSREIVFATVLSPFNKPVMNLTAIIA
jgi:hypothetical protein